MSAVTSPTTAELPTRAGTMNTNSSLTSDGGVSEVDPSSTAGLLSERLQAWKHAVAYLEDYMTAIEKIHKAHAKEYERALKAISNPLKQGHHFDQSLGGIAGFFENMRSNTQALINSNLETEKSIKGSVLPVLDRLHKEIKSKSKELTSGVEKTAKEVDRSRNSTQKHIELLGQHTAAFESSGGKLEAHDDPYVLNKGVLHRLHKQVMEENNNRNDLIAVQNNFSSFEAHVVQVIQQTMESFTILAGGQGEKVKALHYDMLNSVQRIPPDFEWANFTTRNADRLIDPSGAPSTVDSIVFPNMNHAATKALIEGSLERKSRNKLSWGTTTAYYVVTPSKFLHEFKDSDVARQDPKPELSIYLPDAVIGTPSGEKFNVKGKDRSKGLSAKLSGSSELAFRAHTAADAQKWFEVIRGVAGATGPAGSPSPASSPVFEQHDKMAAMSSPTSPTAAGEPRAQEAGIADQVPAAAPPSAGPVNAAQDPATMQAPATAQAPGVAPGPGVVPGPADTKPY